MMVESSPPDRGVHPMVYLPSELLAHRIIQRLYTTGRTTDLHVPREPMDSNTGVHSTLRGMQTYNAS